MTERQLYTVREFCERNSIGKTRFYELVKRGDVRVVKLGRKTLIPATFEQEFLAHVLAHVPKPDRGKPQRTLAVKNEH